MSFDEEQWRKQWFQPKPPRPDVEDVKAAIEEIRSYIVSPPTKAALEEIREWLCETPEELAYVQKFWSEDLPHLKKEPTK